jgi:outer membrane autotransporter protein
MTFFGAAGTAVIGTDGNDVINNYYFMLGSVDLETGANAINNQPGAVYWSGTDVKLGLAGNTLTNDGVIAPGGPVNVLTTSITGSFVQSAGAVYGLDLDLTPNTADRINATGTAVVSGTIPINILNPGMAQTGDHKLTIVHADGGQTHSALALSFIPSAVTTYSLSYTSTDIELNYNINYKPAALSGNQGSVGNAINQLQSGRNSPAFVPIGSSIFYIPTVEALGRAYDSLSGEGTSGTQQGAFAVGGMFTQLMMSQVANAISGGFEDAPGKLSFAYAPEPIGHPAFAALKSPAVYAATWRGWFAGFGGQQTVDGETRTGSAGLLQKAAGGAFGFDYRAAPDVLIGFATGASTSNFQVRDRATFGDMEGAHVGVYGVKTWGQLYLASTLSYSRFENKTTRTIAGIGILPTEVGSGKFSADQVAARIEAGWKHEFGRFTVTPFAAVQFSELWQHAYTEASFLQSNATPGMLGNSFASHATRSLPTFLGAQIESRTTFADGVVWTPYLRAAWVHEFLPDRAVVPSFIAAPGFPFTIEGARAVGDAAKIDAGAKLSVGASAFLFGNLTGEFSPRGNTVSGTGGLKFGW